MRIAFAMINCNRRDGSARPVNEVAERLARRGHDVHLFARTAEDLDLMLVKWHRIPGPGWPAVLDFSSYNLLSNLRFLRHDYEIIHSIGCNTLMANVVTIQNIQPAKAKAMAPFEKQQRLSLARRFTRRLYSIVTSRAEYKLYTARARKKLPVFLPVSRGVEAELRAHYAIGQAPVRIVPNAADTRIFHPVNEEERISWRASVGISPDDFVGIFCGGEWGRKGLELAIRSVALARQKRIKLFVAGDDPDQRIFRQMAADLDITERIVFGGFRKDVSKALGASDVFLFPSHYEAFSLATIEAAACGLPVLASRINGTEDFIQPGVTGEFIPYDAEEIGKLLDVLSANPARCREMGNAARELVTRKYTWDHVADLTEEAYKLAV